MIILNTETTPVHYNEQLIHEFTCPACVCVQKVTLPCAIAPSNGWLIQFFECSCGEILGLRQA